MSVLRIIVGEETCVTRECGGWEQMLRWGVDGGFLVVMTGMVVGVMTKW